MSDERSQNRIISIDEVLVESQRRGVVRETVEETLNKMLDAEADECCANAGLFFPLCVYR